MSKELIAEALEAFRVDYRYLEQMLLAASKLQARN